MAAVHPSVDARQAQLIKERSGENVSLCLQCKKCTSGCPLASEMDLTPTQVMRALQLNLLDMVLNSKTIWLCACCETCTTRCPQGIDVARVMDDLKALAVERGVKPKVPSVATFNRVAMRTIKTFGRMYELGLMGELNLRAGRPFKDFDLAIKMFRAGKLRLLPPRVHYPSRSEVLAKPRPESNGRRVAYYPGCSLHSVAAEYDASTRAVCQTLGLELAEPEGWVCCGSTPAHSTSHFTATLLPLKSLSLVERQGASYLTLPCASCFSRFKRATYEVERDPELRRAVAQELGVPFMGVVEVRHLVDTFLDKVGLEEIAGRVIRPLSGTKLVCYYGCLLTRPPEVTQAEHPEYPMSMDRIVTALGATGLDWSHKTECCGASLSLTETKLALKLTERILKDARDVGAEAVVTACPLCHPNLDSRQAQIRRELGQAYDLPILYISQLMGLAFGLDPTRLGLDKHFVDVMPFLRGKGMVD